MDEKERTFLIKQQEIYNLKTELSGENSEIGDYKIFKTYEARLKGEDDPYDTDTLLKDRQAVRDKINQLQKELEALDSDA